MAISMLAGDQAGRAVRITIRSAAALIERQGDHEPRGNFGQTPPGRARHHFGARFYLAVGRGRACRYQLKFPPRALHRIGAALGNHFAVRKGSSIDHRGIQVIRDHRPQDRRREILDLQAAPLRLDSQFMDQGD